VVVVSVLVPLAVSTVALKNLLGLPPGWWLDWSANVKMASAPGGNMNPTIANIGSTFLVNFQTVVGFFTTNRQICNLITYTLLAGLAIALLVITKLKIDKWQALAFLTILLLLASYHRYYDVQLLMLCTNAALQLYRKPQPVVWAGTAAAVMLWFPLEAMAANVLPYPTPAAASFWQFLAFRNQPLCLFVIALVFAWALIRNARPLVESQPERLASH